MFLMTKKVEAKYMRPSKLGQTHLYTRVKTLVVFLCDNCQDIFTRDLGKIDHRRLSNEFFHVCSNCNQKSFAQRKGVERRQLWKISVDSELDITKF